MPLPSFHKSQQTDIANIYNCRNDFIYENTFLIQQFRRGHFNVDVGLRVYMASHFNIFLNLGIVK